LLSFSDNMEALNETKAALNSERVVYLLGCLEDKFEHILTRDGTVEAYREYVELTESFHRQQEKKELLDDFQVIS